MMRRRGFVLSAAAVLPAAAANQGAAPMKLGIDLFSIRSSGWSPFEYLDYCAKWKARVVHFSEIRFLGSLEEAHLKRVRAHAEKLGIELEIGMRSICPTSKSFDAAQGTAEEQIGRMCDAARVAGSRIVRAFLGTSEDRRAPGGIEAHIAAAARALKAARPRVQDAGVKLAIENHAGDMQARELKTLIEESGDHVGACIDSGNPAWTLEDPHRTLEVLHPYVLTSHVRDSAVWRVPEGIAVRWVRMGEGNVGIDEWVRKYRELCPDKTVSLEVIVTPQPRLFRIFDPAFWDAYRNVPAWEFARFLAIAERGKPLPGTPVPREQQAAREREDLEASLAYISR
jgi:sugar phosphate isomerase/epimerase